MPFEMFGQAKITHATRPNKLTRLQMEPMNKGQTRLKRPEAAKEGGRLLLTFCGLA